MLKASSGLEDWEKIIKNSLDLICTIDRDGCYKNINEACKTALGYEREELIGSEFSHFVHSEDLVITDGYLKEILAGRKVKNFRNRKIHKSGKELLFLWSGTWSVEEEVMLCVGRDISDLEHSRIKSELHQYLVEHGSDMLALFDAELNCLFSGTSTETKMGHKAEELLGKNAFSFIHPDDHPLVKESLAKVLVSGRAIKISDFRFKDAQGNWRWIETTLSNQLHNPTVNALVASSIDITEKVTNRLKLQESEQKFKSLFDHHMDMVLFQDREGAILDVNPAGLSFFEIQRQDILNRPLSDFVPSEVAEVCCQNLQKALKGEPIRTELEVPIDWKGEFVFDIAKIPVEINGEIIGVYSILKDITEISRSNNIIRRQAEKLNTIMESITQAFFTLDKDWRFSYVNQELEKLFRIDKNELLGRNFWDLADDNIKQHVYPHFSKAVKTGKPAYFDFFSEKHDKWLQIKAFPSEEGLSIFFDDITDRVRSQQELEKLSLVANKTTNGVVILNAEGTTEWVNEGFVKLTGYSFEEVVGKKSCEMLQGEETDLSTVNSISERIKQGKPFKEELINYKKSGEKMWLLLDMTPVKNEEGAITRLIIIQTDISFKKETEEGQLQLTRDLFRQNRDLQQFSYIVSHNLRSPVANAMGLIDIIDSGDKSQASMETPLAYLKTSVYQLDTVLRDLNTILSIRDKTDTLENEKIQLFPVFQQVLSAFHEQLEACGGEVDIDISESVFVRGNKAYLYSIFYNLLSNAIKYRSVKRALKVRAKCYSNTEKGIVVSFSDNGSGFDLKLAGDKIFKLYKRFHAKSEGRGLGLFLVKTHLEAIGGHIEVNSTVNAGTRFLVYLK